MAKRKSPTAAGPIRNQSKQEHYTTIARRIKANRRYMRATLALLEGSVDRPKLDKIIGTTNGPEYISRLKGLGLGFRMERINGTDRDTRPSWWGRYHLSPADREGLRKAFAKLGGV